MSEQIINEIKKFSPVVFVFIIICFFLPFVSVSCGGEKIITLSGVQLVTGTTVEEPGSQEDVFGRTKRESERVDPEPLATVALVATLAGLGLSFTRSRKSAIVPAIAGGIAAISLLAMKYKIDSEVLRETEGALQAEYNFGFWLAFLFSILAVVLNLFLFRKKAGQQSQQASETDLFNASSLSSVSEEMVGGLSALHKKVKASWQSLSSPNRQKKERRVGVNIMRSVKSDSFTQFITPVIKLTIGLIGLLVIRYIVSVIPMIKDARVSGMPVTPLQAVRAVINTLILVVVLNFGRELKKVLQSIFSNFTEAGYAANLGVTLIVISGAYTAYDELIYPFIDREYRWVYSVSFLCIALIPIYLLASTLYQNIDKFTNLLVGKFRAGVEETSVCSNCGEVLSPDAKFCPNCGQEIAKAEIVSCPNCGAEIESGASFCKECGTQIEQQPSETVENTEEQEE